jgi:hypothetical protein
MSNKKVSGRSGLSGNPAKRAEQLRYPGPSADVDETHEPDVPENWPNGHVSVALTSRDVDECIEVTIHGVKHYLHSTTARALSNMLLARLDEWNRQPALPPSMRV